MSKISKLGRVLVAAGMVVLASGLDALTIDVQKARKDAVRNKDEIVTNVTFDLNLPYGSISNAGLVQPLSDNSTNQSGIVFGDQGTIYINADSEYGLYRTVLGKLAVSAATWEDYEEGTSWYKPITPAIIGDILDPFAKRVGDAVTGNFASLDEYGDLVDSGYNPGSFAPSNDVVYKVTTATNDNLAVFAADGSIKDTGITVSQFATATQGTTADNAIPKVPSATNNNFAAFIDGSVKDSGVNSGTFATADQGAKADRAVLYRTDVTTAVDLGVRKIDSIVDEYSVVEGLSCTASGYCTHAEGYNTIANDNYSHTEGYNTVANGYASHAEGYATKTQNHAEHAQGQYNLSHTVTNTFGYAENTLSSIGFGNSNANRRNAVEVMQDGKTFIYGLGGYDGTNPTNSTDIATCINNKASSSHTHTLSDISNWNETTLTNSIVFKQSVQSVETDPTIYTWAKAETKPSYTWSEISGTPTKVSDFTNDENYIKLTEFKQKIREAVTNDIPVIEDMNNFTEEDLARSINELAGALNRLRAAALEPQAK